MNSELYQSAILGLLQGLTEFLPISSSAHLVVLPWLMGWEPFGLTFDVLLHVGTLVAVLLYFRRDWGRIVSEVLSGRWLRSGPDGFPLTAALIIGTVPVIAGGLVAADEIEAALRGPGVAAVNLAVFGVLLLAADRLGRRSRGFASIGWRDALLIGLAQGLALAPGVSRSGITMTAALMLGFGRGDAARFSFLLAGPAIGLAGAKSLLDLGTGAAGGSFTVLYGAVGIMMAAGSGFLCIKYLLRFLQSGSFLPFVLYRCGLALLIACWLWL